jgi:hypothetical protein
MYAVQTCCTPCTANPQTGKSIEQQARANLAHELQLASVGLNMPASIGASRWRQRQSNPWGARLTGWRLRAVPGTLVCPCVCPPDILAQLSTLATPTLPPSLGSFSYAPYSTLDADLPSVAEGEEEGEDDAASS